jgi:radical SAM-linked protein
MPRLLFEKKGNAVWISHLDLMRLFQRAFKRAGLPLKHTQGYSPKPLVSIALPLSVGIESCCELLDFELEGECVPCDEILARLNTMLIDGVKVLAVYENGGKIKDLTLMDCIVELEYDAGVPTDALDRIRDLFASDSLLVEKKGKNGTVQQDIIPMIKNLSVCQTDGHTVQILGRICCQNPTLNPAQIAAAVCRYLPELTPDFSKCSRLEIYNAGETIFR